MSRSLLAIGDDLISLDALLTEMGGDVTDAEQEAAIDAWLNELGAERDAKLDAYCALIHEMEHRAEARKAEADRILKLSKSDEAAAGRLRERLLYFFRLQGLDKVETARFRLKLTRSGGKLPLVVDLPAEQLPPHFQRTKITVSADQDAIRHALDEGTPLTFARYGERSESVRIS